MIKENLEKLKNDFAMELKYKEYEGLDKITKKMFEEIQSFIDVCDSNDPNIMAMRVAKNKAQSAHRIADLQEFINQIDVISLLLEIPYVQDESELIIKDGQESRFKTKEIEEWIEEKKTVNKMEMIDILRAQQKIFKILERI